LVQPTTATVHHVQTGSRADRSTRNAPLSAMSRTGTAEATQSPSDRPNIATRCYRSLLGLLRSASPKPISPFRLPSHPPFRVFLTVIFSLFSPLGSDGTCKLNPPCRYGIVLQTDPTGLRPLRRHSHCLVSVVARVALIADGAVLLHAT
jgi:hypothetical protein